ncbi:hypothetical protein [Psychromarinibacter sp. S121]|uniref:hypothetical protein n=1 Tax=Psychromarinibacter sp. S121 TaxID=3415127 RepID=UPI003C7C7B40
MTIKQRLRNAERKRGVGEEEILFFMTHYEKKDGTSDFATGRAYRRSGIGGFASILSVKGESAEEFRERAARELSTRDGKCIGKPRSDG